MDHRDYLNHRPADPGNLTVVASATHSGLLRKTNEDCRGVSIAHGAFVVCDGMGGAAAGEVASQLAVTAFLESIGSASISSPPVERLSQAIQEANQAVLRRAHATSELEGMGTTLVAALFDPAPRDGSASPAGTLWIAHVGDSRCYLHRQGRLSLLTIDHSIVEQQVQAGLLTREEAETSPVRHVITRALGSQPHVEAEFLPVDSHPHDLFLLASDGLNRELNTNEINEILSSLPRQRTRRELAASCQSLIDAANAHGGHDNITVILLQVGQAT